MKNKTSLVPGISPLAYLSVQVKLLAGGFMVLFMAAVFFAAPSLHEPSLDALPLEIQHPTPPLTDKKVLQEVGPEAGTDAQYLIETPD